MEDRNLVVNGHTLIQAKKEIHYTSEIGTRKYLTYDSGVAK